MMPKPSKPEPKTTTPKEKATKTKTKTTKAKAKAKAKVKVKAPDPYAPGKRQVLENGMFALFFDSGDFDGDLDVVGAFESEDLEGSGYDWEAVLAPALKKHDRKAFSEILEWAPEADTFVAIAKTEAPLLALAEVLGKVLSSQAALAKAVAGHDPDRT